MNSPVVFDIDLDFFLDRTSEKASSERLADDEYEVWSDEKVSSFLREQLGLGRGKKPLGFRCETHDEVLRACMRLCDNGRLEEPFHLLHIDAHDDLDAWRLAVDVATMHARKKERPSAEDSDLLSEVDETNYVCFLLAMGMLSKYTFVHLRDSNEPCSMLLDFYGNLRTVSVPVLQEPYEHYLEEVPDDSETASKMPWPVTRRIGDDELVRNPIWAHYLHFASDEYQADNDPAFLFVTRSPQYTPKKADRIISELVEPLVDFENGEKLLGRLGQELRFKG